MKQLGEALARFVQQQNLYNEVYGLFHDHDIRPRTEKLIDCWDSRIPVSPELEYLYSYYEMIDANAAETRKLKNAAVEIGDARTFKGELKDEDTYETKNEFIEHVEPLLHHLLGENQTTYLFEYLSLC
ncbi:hypothetical protein E4V51_21995 [Paenibacillus sp. 28ISP30-2]|nr:hypothetical protein [Paenibacillus sp. 28ISP30-2]